MKIGEFEELDEAQKASVLKFGDYLDGRFESGNHIQFYNLGEFIVELHYSPTLNGIVNFRTFENEWINLEQ